MNARFLALTAVVLAGAAHAQVCDFSLCPAGWEYRPGGTDADGPYGSCHHCDGFPTFACAHTLDHCPRGSTLNPKTGVCTWNLCTGGCGGELPLCDANERYAGSGVDASGKTFGSCQRGPDYPLGPIAHQLKYCREGWTLQTASGMCRKDCLADLVILGTWLQDSGGSYVSSVHAGQKYSICALVKNVGTSSSGACSLSGGGLAVPYTPTTSVPALYATATVSRCLTYATTPAVGTWRVGLTVDSSGVVTEAAEGNNTATVTVTVVP